MAQVNMNIIEGEPFFAHEASINFTPTQVSLDFKCITPRTDPRSQKPSFQLKHNVVMIDPWHAKELIGVLREAVKKYEEEFGSIKKPKAVLKAEEKQRALAQQAGDSKTAKYPTYTG
ncbi:DUF3467 domain-containing protein [Candidatus Woesearchaeota archaeon]|nr:MAG: DUF3467 domain-containing protein [Candidatus Woesearchaeota archaeon]